MGKVLQLPIMRATVTFRGQPGAVIPQGTVLATADDGVRFVVVWPLWRRVLVRFGFTRFQLVTKPGGTTVRVKAQRP